MDDEPLTAQECAEAIRGWVRQMPGGGEQYLDQLLDMILRQAPTVLDDVAALRKRLGGELEDALTVERYAGDLARLDRIEAWIREHQ